MHTSIRIAVSRVVTILCPLCVACPGIGAQGAPIESMAVGASAVYAAGNLDVYGERHDIDNLGAMGTISYGRAFTAVAGLELGCSVSLLSFGNESPLMTNTSFDVDIDPTPEGVLTTGCVMKTSITAALFLARWCYNLEIEWLLVGVEVGIGGGVFYERNDWGVANPDYPTTDLFSDLERVHSLKPVVAYGLRLGFRLGSHNVVGLTAGGIGFPLLIRNDDINYDFIPNLYLELGPYQVNHAWQAGVFWKALS